MITLAGIALLIVRDSLDDIRFQGLFIAMCSALCYALYIITVK